MGMARLMGGSTPRFLVQVLSIKPYRAEALTIIRCAQSSNLGDGSGSQTNRVGTTSVKDKPVATNPTDKSSGKGNGQVNDQTTESNA